MKKLFLWVLVGVFICAAPAMATTVKDNMRFTGTVQLDNTVDFQGDIIGIIGYGGDVWYVDSVTGTDTLNDNYGKSKNKPFATIDYANGAASDGDIIFVLATHVETLSGASSIEFDTAGLEFIALGVGRARPQLNYGSGTTPTTIVFSAANVTLDNFYITMSGVSNGISNGIQIVAANATIRNCEFIMSNSAGSNAEIAIQLDSNADRANISNNIFDSGVTSGLNESATANAIAMTGTAMPDNIVITNNMFRGYFSAGPIYYGGSSSTAGKNWVIAGNESDLTNDGYEPSELSEETPVLASPLVPQHVSRIDSSGVTNLFSVNGPVRLLSMVGVVTSAIANNDSMSLSLVVDPIEPATNTNLCAATVVTSDAAGTVYTFSGVSIHSLIPTTNGVVFPAQIGQGETIASATTPYMIPAEGIIIPSGTIEQAWSTAGTTGTIEWHLIYQPLKQGASVRPD